MRRPANREPRCDFPTVEAVYVSRMDRVGLRPGALVLTLLFGWALTASPAAAPQGALARGDLRWLSRVTFGIDNATIADYKRLGPGEVPRRPAPSAGRRSGRSCGRAIAAIPVTQQSAEAEL